MKMKTQIVAVASLTGLAISISAFGSDSSRRGVQVDLPTWESAGEISEFEEQPGSFRAVDRPSYVELHTSSWVPNQLALPSRVQGTSTFEAGPVPLVGLAFLVPVGDPDRQVDLAFRTGISAIRVERQGYASVTGVPQLSKQNLYLLPVQLGIEARPKRLRWKALSLFASASVVPILALTQRSIFDAGRTYFGLSGEVSVGLESTLGWVNPDLSTASLTIEGHGGAGALSGEILRGGGVRGGVRVRL